MKNPLKSLAKFGGKPAATTRLSGSVKADILAAYIDLDDGIPVTESQAMSVPAFALSVGLISDLIAQLPLRLIKRTDNDVVVIDNHNFHDVWDMPAGESRPTFSGPALVKWSLQKALIYGNAYIRIWRADSGKIIRRLEPICPRRVTLEVKRGEIIYKIASSPDSSGDVSVSDQLVKPRDIIHIRGRYLDAEGICGVSTLSLLKTTLNICLAQNRHARDSLVGKNIHRYITVDSGDNPEGEGLNEEEIRAIKDEFNSAQGDNTVPVLDGSVKVNTDRMPNTELQFTEGRSQQVLEIARTFGVPPPMVFHMQGITAWGSGLASIISAFQKSCLIPWAISVENAFGMMLLTRDERKQGYRFDFDMSALDRMSPKDRALYYRQMVDGGLMSVEEVRAQEGLRHVEGTDVLLPPKNNPAIVEPEPKTQPGDDMPSPEDAPSGEPKLSIVK